MASGGDLSDVAAAAAPADAPELEDALLVEPRRLTAAYDALQAGGCLVRRWHLGGRFGVRIRWPHGGPGPWKAIPLIPAAAQRMALYMERLACLGNGADSEDSAESVPESVRSLLKQDGVALGRIPAVEEYVHPLELKDNAVHPERRVSLPLPRTGPPPGAFTFAELFAGVGGFRVALQALGGSCVFASEIEAKAVEVYRHNFGDTPTVTGDIWEVDVGSIPDHDMLVGGFPCQPFSGLGTQPGLEDDKGQLFRAIVRVLRAKRPRCFLLENVPGLQTTDEGRALEAIMAALEDVGYRVSMEVVNARCLTAQCRRRLYFVGRLGEESTEDFQFPYIPDLQLRAEDVLVPEPELRAAGEADAFTLSDEQFSRLQQCRCWESAGPNKLAWGSKICDTLVSHYGSGCSAGTCQLVPRAAPHHPRRFTPLECRRLMAFPEGFAIGDWDPDSGHSFPAWCRSRYRLFGNAVCPPVIAALAGAVLHCCITPPAQPSALDWVSLGRGAALRLALQALPAARRGPVLRRLGAPWSEANEIDFDCQ